MKTTNPTRQLVSFWPLQLGGWFIYAVANAAALIPYRHARDQVACQTMLVIYGFFGSFGMYAFCRALRRRHVPTVKALLTAAGIAYVLSVPGSAATTWAEIRFGNAPLRLEWGATLANAVYVASIFVAWSAFYLGVKHYQDLEEQRSRLLASEALAREAQLRALRYQLQPHFLFNTLNAISTLVLDDKPKVATQMISRLAGLLRSTLDAPETHKVSLTQEVAVTEEYLAIEQARFGARLSVSYQIEPASTTAQVPRFLLQPLVENAVRHGIAKRLDGGAIIIRARSSDKRLHIDVENEAAQGAGTSVANSSRQDGGVGLANTKQRLEQLYGSASTLVTSQTAEGNFVVSISLPFVSSNVETPAQNWEGAN